MLLGALLLASSFAAAPVGGEGALAGAGERVADAVVEGVETHPEYERYALRQPDGSVAIVELTTGTGGLCDVGGLTVFPRADLSGVPGALGAEALCARLEERTPSLRARIGPDGARGGEKAGGTGEGGGASERRPGDPPEARAAAETASAGRAPGGKELHAPRVDTPLSFVLLSLLALAAWRGRPDRLLVGVSALAFAARLALSPRGVGNGAMAGYEKLVLARGTLVSSPYGEAWGALLGPVPDWPDGVFWANAVLASLSAGLLACITRCVAGGRAGLFAGLALAILPTHLGVSFTETMHVSVLAFQLAAVLGALSWARSRHVADGLIAALAAGVAAHLRPDALPFLLVPVLVGAFGARGVGASGSGASWGGGATPPRNAPPNGNAGGDVPPGRPTPPAEAGLLARALDAPALQVGLPVVALIGLGVWRAGKLGGTSGGLVQLPDWTVLLPRFGEAEKERAFQLFLHAGFTPPVLWGLALVGAASLWRGGRRALLAGLAAWVLLTTGAVSAKVWPLVDAIRLQLPGQAPWLVLAAIGAARLPPWTGVVALLAFLQYFPLRPWVQTEEWAFLRAAVPTLPEGTTVRYDPRPQRAGTFAAVMEWIGPATWASDRGELVYVGLECRARGGCDTSGCVAEQVTRLEGRVDLDLRLEDRTIGFWRCAAGEPPPAYAPAPPPSAEAPADADAASPPAP